MSQTGQGFSKTARLTRRSEFLRVSRSGKKFHTSHFVIITQSNDTGENRIGITVSSRVGKAVVRNRIKRLLREYFRRHRHEMALSQDIVIIARRGAERLSFSQAGSEIREALATRQR